MMGNCYGFNLVYSGNHYEAVEVNSFDKTRIVSGINLPILRLKLHQGNHLKLQKQ